MPLSFVMQTFIIQKNEAGQRFDKYLKKRLPEAKASFLYKMLRKKNITLNGKKAEGRELLSEGDAVTLFFSEETYEKFRGAVGSESWKTDPRYVPPEVLLETEDLIFFNKPAGLLSQKAREKDFSANEQLLRYLYETGKLAGNGQVAFRPSIANRLDRNTSGILIGGKTLTGLKESAELLREKKVRKYYHALVHGTFPEAICSEGYLKKDRSANRSEFLKEAMPGAAYIRTDFMPLSTSEGITLLSVQLHTGKSHQIRAHLSALGFPILGDPKYGNRKLDERFRKYGLSRQMLHMRTLLLPDGTSITAPYPADFERVLEAIPEVR